MQHDVVNQSWLFAFGALKVAAVEAERLEQNKNMQEGGTHISPIPEAHRKEKVLLSPQCIMKRAFELMGEKPSCHSKHLDSKENKHNNIY